ncbi:hypothetical protein CH63R_04773 [Colletotrichum higginsianum IMI 349063]|uniref:Uncharacterized protein n=1 Tax=Colletotrichum higginsianum (strain IMI 349063) TaxID=759273 RepID=A0A1B7YK82_COLHI|nr:hypothetical protein CH63R_04773 [Colletotrichum higginsianum IMI 349063]OBR12477.1 hypothetical protein CH63R_04773 [Colletotrichum higginsianum IMI 349063]
MRGQRPCQCNCSPWGKGGELAGKRAGTDAPLYENTRWSRTNFPGSFDPLSRIRPPMFSIFCRQFDPLRYGIAFPVTSTATV